MQGESASDDLPFTWNLIRIQLASCSNSGTSGLLEGIYSPSWGFEFGASSCSVYAAKGRTCSKPRTAVSTSVYFPAVGPLPFCIWYLIRLAAVKSRICSLVYPALLRRRVMLTQLSLSRRRIKFTSLPLQPSLVILTVYNPRKRHTYRSHLRIPFTSREEINFRQIDFQCIEG